MSSTVHPVCEPSTFHQTAPPAQAASLSPDDIVDISERQATPAAPVPIGDEPVPGDGGDDVPDADENEADEPDEGLDEAA